MDRRVVEGDLDVAITSRGMYIYVSWIWDMRSDMNERYLGTQLALYGFLTTLTQRLVVISPICWRPLVFSWYIKRISIIVDLCES